MPYVPPSNNLVALLVTNESARRRLCDQDRRMRAADWTNTDPGRGPVRGFSGGRR